MNTETLPVIKPVKLDTHQYGDIQFLDFRSEGTLFNDRITIQAHMGDNGIVGIYENMDEEGESANSVHIWPEDIEKVVAALMAIHDHLYEDKKLV